MNNPTIKIPRSNLKGLIFLVKDAKNFFIKKKKGLNFENISLLINCVLNYKSRVSRKMTFREYTAYALNALIKLQTELNLVKIAHLNVIQGRHFTIRFI